LRLELKLLADVGVVGLPNAGKSTLLRAVSAATPKVADYPFTTLTPQLGVVSRGAARSFVMVDVPGLIEGAAQGVGLGTRFLRHLQRTRLLIHLIDLAPADGHDMVTAMRQVEAELAAYDAELAARERWLVFNKADLLPDGDAAALANKLAQDCVWSAPVFTLSAAQRQGVDSLCEALMQRLEALDEHGKEQNA
jgi:GTP-binding protein